MRYIYIYIIHFDVYNKRLSIGLVHQLKSSIHVGYSITIIIYVWVKISFYKTTKHDPKWPKYKRPFSIDCM